MGHMKVHSFQRLCHNMLIDIHVNICLISWLYPVPGLTYTDTDRFQWHETSKSCLSVFVCRLYWNCPQVDDRNTRVWLEQSLIYAGRDHMFSVSGD